ncbi:MAG: ATPase [Planctomycetes bacterium RBG_16_64_12]|nr:MAG: ATPase [Planctomycetes bacterium RBG_16_64_12]
MYESYWQLDEKPFENCCDPRFYYPSESHQAALLKLRYAVENSRGAAVLAGPSGSGKTLVLSMLRTTLGEEFTPFVHLVFPQMPIDQVLAYLADELSGSVDGLPEPGVQKSVHRIEHFLAENSRGGRHAVVAIDEAHLLDDGRAFEAMRLLLNFELAGRPGMTLLLVGQPGILPTLDRIPQLEERLAVKCLLRPFTERETSDYVSHRLHLAGAARTIFEPDAMPTLHRLTHGVARRINRLSDLALLIGYAEERRAVSAAQLEAVSHELIAVVPE